MKAVLHKAEERGQADHGWLSTRYSFSFADWFEVSRMGFGALRVLNDDRIAPATGFGAHPHRNMEIITIVTVGAVSHTDNMGNRAEVKAGEVQVMSAGTGVIHAEKNDSSATPLALFQIWIQPKELDIEPRYAQKSFDFKKAKGLVPLIAPGGVPGALSINQDAFISYAALEKDELLAYEMSIKGNGVYIFMIEGTALVAGKNLSDRDALGVSETEKVEIEALSSARILLIEVPL